MEIKQKDFETFLKRAYQRVFQHYGRTYKYVDVDKGQAELIMREKVRGENPVMIARFGSNELQTIVAYLKESNTLRNIPRYEKIHWEDIDHKMHMNAGFFPKGNVQMLRRFAELMLRDIDQLDFLGSWRKEEFYLKRFLGSAKRIELKNLEPYFSSDPWSKYLESKKVLVIHPFSNTIRSQYEKRHLLFDNKDILPEFELTTIRAVQTIAGNKDSRFATWFEALDFMKSEIDRSEFEIALIGCGAYGFPLAAHVKRMGKKSIQLGGSLQLLFGIKGKRWEGREKFDSLMNEHWVYPSEEDIPTNKEVVEGGCYWK
jgi:hypothetical protein